MFAPGSAGPGTATDRSQAGLLRLAAGAFGDGTDKSDPQKGWEVFCTANPPFWGAALLFTHILYQPSLFGSLVGKMVCFRPRQQ